jgi:hypothetical protein
VKFFGRGRTPDAEEHTKVAERLVGMWYGRVNGEPVGMDFRADGRMAYVVQSGGTAQHMILAWRLEGGQLVTNQPSAPREERSDLRLDGDDLVITFGRIATRFTR